VHGPWRQPAALLPKIVDKLNEKEKEGHLAKVMQPTDWGNSMVISSRGEKIRICLDPADLNDSVKREHYPTPSYILVAGRDISHHDSVLEKVLYRAKSYNLKLNFDKVRVRKQQMPYVGHIISAEGQKPDPEKVRAMKEMPPPTTKEDVRRFLGSIQYLAKFLPMLAEVETPLRDAPQTEAFQRLKDLCCTAPVLA